MSKRSGGGSVLRIAVVTAGLCTVSLTGCQASGPGRGTNYIPPAPAPCSPPELTLTAREAARRDRRLSRPPGAPFLMPPPTATVLAPALPTASSLEPPLGPYWLGDDTVLSPNVDSERIERFEPGPLMPPLEEPRIAFDALLPSSETIPPEPEAAWPGEPDKPSIADMDGYELRLAAVEQQLQTSQAALQAVTVALQISQTDIAHLRREVAFAHDEVQRLEDLLESRHAADLESLEQLSTALDSLIRRTEERQAVREGTNR